MRLLVPRVASRLDPDDVLAIRDAHSCCAMGSRRKGVLASALDAALARSDLRIEDVQDLWPRRWDRTDAL